MQKTIISMSKKIKDICKKNNVVFYSSVTTNGYELDIETFKAFIKLGIRYFQITLDGDIETHNFQRPHRTNNNSFQKIYSNLQEIKTLPPNFRFEIGIRINVSRLNFPNMFEFINNRLIYFKNDSRFKIIWQWVRDWGGDRITGYKDSLLCSKNLCHDLIKETCQKGLESYESLTHSSGIDHCEAVFYNGYVIDYLGRVLKCSLKTQSSSDIETNCIGYINDSGKMVLEKNREYKWFNLMPPSKCMECNIYPMCMSQSCPLSNATTQCPKCVEFKELIPSILESIHISKKCTSIIFPGE